MARRAFEAILGEPIDPEKFQRMLLEGVVHSVTEPGSTAGADIDFVAVSHRRSPWLAIGAPPPSPRPANPTR